MKKSMIKNMVLLLSLATLAGCGGKGEKPLSEEHFNIAIEQIALTVPLAVEKVTGVTMYTNAFRAKHGTSMPVLKDGNDLTLITKGELNYEDEVNEIYLSPSFTVEWSFLQKDGYGEFKFEADSKTGALSAVPQYPTYKPEYDANDKPIHVVPAAKSARLYAIVKIGERSATINIDLVMNPQELIEFYNLIEVRELPADMLVGVRGYVIGVHKDWNSAGIVDGKQGFGIYHLDYDFKDSLKRGDLVEIVGKTSSYNGLSQLSFIKKVKVLDPDAFPDIKKPELQEYSLETLRQQLTYKVTELNGPLQDKDNSMIRFTEPFKLVRIENRDKTDVGFDGFNIAGNDHTNVILEGKTTEGKTFEVKLSMNYHIGGDEQLKFKNFLMENQTKEFYYTGPLSLYNEFVLGPYEFESEFGPALRLSLD